MRSGFGEAVRERGGEWGGQGVFNIQETVCGLGPPLCVIVCIKANQSAPSEKCLLLRHVAI